jgi:hypothetical protein
VHSQRKRHIYVYINNNILLLLYLEMDMWRDIHRNSCDSVGKK